MENKNKVKLVQTIIPHVYNQLQFRAIKFTSGDKGRARIFLFIAYLPKSRSKLYFRVSFLARREI